MKHIGIIICLFLIYSCDNHDFVFDEEEQAFYINDMLHFSIESLDTVKGAFEYDFFRREIKPYHEVDTLPLRKRIPEKFKVIESSFFSRNLRYHPPHIRLKPNVRYVVKHNGMGAKVNITKYFHTDSSGRLHSDE